MAGPTPGANGIGTVANNHQWTGSRWVALPVFAPMEARRTRWYRRPWALVLASLLASIVVLSVLGITPDAQNPQEQGDG